MVRFTLPAPGFHWMTIDTLGLYADSQKSFGNYFERVTPQKSKPTLIMCSDFPLVVGKDGNIYYAYTRPGSARIVRRTPEGKESVVASHESFEYINGIATGPDGSIYITESSNTKANTVRKITRNGTVSVIATYTSKNRKNIPLETAASYLRGLFVDSTGTIYVAATRSRCVLKISPQGNLTTLFQTTNYWTPTGVVLFGGELYALEWHDVPLEKMEIRGAWIPRVRKITRGGKLTTLATISR
jgi:streptogramin lyase